MQDQLQMRSIEHLEHHLSQVARRACARHRRRVCAKTRASLGRAAAKKASLRSAASHRASRKVPSSIFPPGLRAPGTPESSGAQSSAPGTHPSSTGNAGGSSAPGSSPGSSTPASSSGELHSTGSGSTGGPAGTEPATGTSATFQPGINSGTNMTLDVQGAALLGAKVVRIEFPIAATAAQMQPVFEGYAAKGIRIAPLAVFAGTLPTPAQARNLATWATTYGPGGTFWAARSDGQLAIQSIEFGNETSGGYQYDDNAGEPSYTARAETYAVRLKEAAQAISASSAKVGLLAVAEDWTGDWMNGMFSAVPNLGSYVAGWVSHPYGSEWRSKIEDILAQTAAHGASATIPIDITEWGLSSDNGSCLNENFGWNPCMTYQGAAETLRRTVAEIQQLLGGRLGLFLFYQVRDQQPTGATHDMEDYFGLLQHELQPKGAYTAAAEELLAS
jgi:hypothetical protein